MPVDCEECLYGVERIDGVVSSKVEASSACRDVTHGLVTYGPVQGGTLRVLCKEELYVLLLLIY